MTQKVYDPVDLYWNYYDKMKKEYGNIENMPEDVLIRLKRMFDLMRKYINLRLNYRTT